MKSLLEVPSRWVDAILTGTKPGGMKALPIGDPNISACMVLKVRGDYVLRSQRTKHLHQHVCQKIQSAHLGLT